MLAITSLRSLFISLATITAFMWVIRFNITIRMFPTLSLISLSFTLPATGLYWWIILFLLWYIHRALRTIRFQNSITHRLNIILFWLSITIEFWIQTSFFIKVLVSIFWMLLLSLILVNSCYTNRSWCCWLWWFFWSQLVLLTRIIWLFMKSLSYIWLFT